MKTLGKRFLRIVGYGLLSVLALLLLGLCWLYWYSDGTTAPIVDGQGRLIPNSIASLEAVDINGTKQWLLIRGYDRTKPVLLFVHGGPGSSEMPIMTNNEALEERFVVVNWDQRGAGKSYDPAVFNKSFTLDTFIEDAAAVSRLLAKRFGQSKIYLMGHSWGSLLGVKVVQKYPELYHAYFGIGQVADQLVGEQQAYDWLVREIKKRGNDKQLAKLTQYGRPPFATTEQWMNYLLPQRDLVTEYGGAMHRGSLNGLIVNNLLLSKEYTLRGKAYYLVGAYKSIERLWQIVIEANLNQTANRLNVPVYMFQGIHDYQTPHAVAKAYFDQLDAPQKQFFTFEQSAHGPIYEEPTLFITRLDSVLN